MKGAMERCVVSYSMFRQVLALGSSHFTRLDCSSSFGHSVAAYCCYGSENE